MLYPLKLKPVLKDNIWGGKRLASEYGKSKVQDKKIAESWELTVHKNGVNIIENGEYANKTLEDLFKSDKSIIAPDYKSDKFPLLIKFIDAEHDLSVQVHPDDIYAAEHEDGELGKTEMWYIIDAAPGAKIVYGLNADYTREDLQKLIDRGRFEECLNYIEVKRGEVYFIPAGLVHAIGAGILIAEVQQNSDTTYRFYDYNRLDSNGEPRELHTKQALDVCVKTKTEINISESCEYFSAGKIICENGAKAFDAGDSFASVICVEGRGEIIHQKNIYKINKGESYFIPAGSGKFEIRGSFEIILTRL
ncbi:MAG: class I mannose-6-phosphate isomerase [Oscillospiraceae bacterium]|nr:class I mannose-6-phosphate isomerase [Oscillospiraceae bacterium]